MAYKKNILPGVYKGVKAKRDKRGLLPRNMGWSWSEMRWIGRDYEKNPGDTNGSWFIPFKSKPTNRKDRRGQSKPR